MKRIFATLAIIILLATSSTPAQTARRRGATNFAGLGTPSDGEIRYCTDCQQTTPCASGGTGAPAERVRGAWSCSAGTPSTAGSSYTITNATSGNAVTLLAAGGATGAGWSFTYPTGGGASGQYLRTDGTGLTNWNTIVKSDVGLGNVANVDTTNASNISSGLLGTARGGFGVNVSAATGVPLWAAGVPTFTATTGTGNVVRATSPTLVTPTADAFTFTQGTLTGSSTPFINHTATWNNAGTTFTNILSNVTSTASNGASLLIDLQVGGISKFKVDRTGIVSASNGAGTFVGQEFQSSGSYRAIAFGVYYGVLGSTRMVVNNGNIQFSGGQTANTRQTTTGTAATTTFNFSNGNIIEFTFGAGNETIALSNIVDGAEYTITMIQDATGSRTATWPATIKWAGGTAPTLSTGTGKRDVFRFYTNGTNLYEESRALDVR